MAVAVVEWWLVSWDVSRFHREVDALDFGGGALFARTGTQCHDRTADELLHWGDDQERPPWTVETVPPTVIVAQPA